MLYELFPHGALTPDSNDCSIQSLLFGHRIKPQQTRYEYLAEFLQIAMSKKRLVDKDSQATDDMFIISDKVSGHMIEYTPVSNMGLKRFIFFDNSRLDTKSAIDDEAYKKCVKILKNNIERETNLIDDKDTIFVLQNILYGKCRTFVVQQESASRMPGGSVSRVTCKKRSQRKSFDRQCFN